MGRDVELVDLAGLGHEVPQDLVGQQPMGVAVAVCDGGGVGPVPGDGFGEHVNRGAWVVGVEGDVGVVLVAASGEGDVDTAVVDGSVDDEQGVVDGAALGGVPGLGVAQLDMGAGVVGG